MCLLLLITCWWCFGFLEAQSNAPNSLTSHVRVAAYHVPPSMIITRNEDGNATYSDVDKDIIDELFKRLHFTYSYVDVNESAQNGMVKQLIQQVLDDEVDICTFGFVATPERVALMDFSIVVETDFYRFVVRYPQPKSRLLGPIRPFQPTVWLLFVVIVIILVLATSVLMFLNQKLHIETAGSARNLTDYISDNAVYVITVIASQGEYLPNRKLSVRLLVGIWCLMAVVLINSYTGNLISYLSVPKLKPIPGSFTELAASSDYKLSIQANTVLMDDFFEYTLHRQSAHPEVSLVTNFLVGEDMKSSGQCRLTVSKRLSMAQSSNYIYPKHSVVRSEIDALLLRFWELGILEKIRENYRPRIDRCLVGAVKPKVARLTLNDLASAYVILAIGIGISVLTFIAENIIGLSCQLKHH